MSLPYDPNDDYGMDDFNIEDYTSRVNFDGEEDQAPYSEAADSAPSGDTGEYTPVGREQEMHPTRKHRRKRQPTSMRVLRRVLIVLIYLLVITFAAYLLATFGWRWANDLLALNKEEVTASVVLEDDMFTEETVTDEEGNTSTVYNADLGRVADTLKENGLIEYKWLFRLFASFTGKGDALAPGTYELNTDMDYSALLRNMGSSSSARATVEVMIPEGYTLDRIFALLEENGVATASELSDAATNYDFDYDFLDDSTLGQSERLEGYLFPDTYEFYVNSEPETVLSRMLSNFQNRVFDEEQVDQNLIAQAEANGYSLRDILTIASIIERETDGVDQTSISSVIYNRLNEGGGTNGYLQMDSTIYYIIGDYSRALTAEDLAIDSPYNTYLYQGLPAGPICCPGLTAIRAALDPDDTDYYYFYLGDDGSTHFFSDYDEFLAFRDSQTGETQTDDGESGDAEG